MSLICFDFDHVVDSTKELCPHLSPQSFDEIPYGTENVLRYGQNDPLALTRVWLSLLAIPGTVLVPRVGGLKQAAWVVDCTDQGILAWNILAKKVAGQRYYVLEREPSAKPLRQLVILNIDDWYTQDLNILCPAEALHYLGEHGLSSDCCIMFTPIGDEPVLVLTFAALQAFRYMCVPQLLKLHKELKIKIAGPRPSTEYPLCMACMREVLTHHSPEELAELIKIRWNNRKLPIDTIFNEADIDGMAGDMEEDEAADLYLLAEKVDEAAKGSTKADGKLKAHLKKMPAKATKKTPLELDGSLDAKEARKYIPPGVVGISISKEMNFYFRWKMQYPKDKPNTVTQCFTMATDIEAMRFCLKGLWAFHLEVNPKEFCPWEF
jgi:hypothetical protein